MADAEGNVTTMVYDSLVCKVEMIDPDMGHWYYQYDLAGNLLTQINVRKQATNFCYNARNEL